MTTTRIQRIVLLVVALVSLSVVSSATAQNPFTFELIEQQALTTMFGSQEWVDLDGDGDMDLVSTGNADNLSLPVLESYQATNLRVWQRQTDSGSIIQVADYASDAIPTGLWLSGSDWLDANNDGIEDLFVSGSFEGLPPFQSRAVVLSNIGGVLSETQLPIAAAHAGNVSTADLDNDGDRDVLITGLADTGERVMKVYLNTGGLTFQDDGQDLPGYAHGGSDLGDYDSDGDIDLVVSGVSGDGSIRTAIYENDGTGSFSLVTDALEGLLYGSVSFGDYDQDGDMDILANGGRLSPFVMTGVTMIIVNDGGSFSSPALELSGAAHGEANWVDFDHDGDLDVVIAGGRQIVGSQSHGRLYQNDQSGFTHVANIAVPLPSTVSLGDYDGDDDVDISFSGLSDRQRPILIQYENRNRVVNNRPSTPGASGAQVNGGLVTLSWQAAEDVETASTGLTYAVRVGTQPGGSDVMSTAARSSDGKRSRADFGNVFQNTDWTIDLPNGTYYWSVQSVDNAFVGSEFSSEQSFTVIESGKGTPTGIDDPDGVVRYEVRSPYPNPFIETTSLAITLPSPAVISIAVYDALGRRIVQTRSIEGLSGSNSYIWDARTDAGSRVGSGTYFIRVLSEYGATTRAVIVR